VGTWAQLLDRQLSGARVGGPPSAVVDEVGAEVGACILVVASDRRELLERFDAEARSPSASHFCFC
jgi:hypothetical protein